MKEPPETAAASVAAAPPGTPAWRSRLWRYGPLIFWMGFIFFASTGQLSASNTSRFIRPLLLWLFPDISDAGLLFGHFIIRKTAHFVEYAVLALLAARAFLSSAHNLLRRQWLLVSFVLVALYALFDEFHQSFVATRTGSIYDSLIDMSGGATALVLLFFWRALQRRRAL